MNVRLIPAVPILTMTKKHNFHNKIKIPFNSFLKNSLIWNERSGPNERENIRKLIFLLSSSISKHMRLYPS